MIEIMPLISHAASSCQTLTGTGCDTGLPQTGATSVQLKELLQIAFAILGALAVLFIVIAGLRYVFGPDSPQEAAKNRNTIIYALVGLAIAITAEAIVSFALGSLLSNS